MDSESQVISSLDVPARNARARYSKQLEATKKGLMNLSKTLHNSHLRWVQGLIAETAHALPIQTSTPCTCTWLTKDSSSKVVDDGLYININWYLDKLAFWLGTVNRVFNQDNKHSVSWYCEICRRPYGLDKHAHHLERTSSGYKLLRRFWRILNLIWFRSCNMEGNFRGDKAGWLGSWISFLQTNAGANNLSGSFNEDEVNDVSLP
jgi:hypothetical protein